MDISGKVVIALGERDGVPGPAIEKIVMEAGAKKAYSNTLCFA